MTQPSEGGASFTGSAVIYASGQNFTGSDSFQYSVNDPFGAEATAAIEVTVTPVNDQPDSANDVASTLVDVGLTIDVLANDPDMYGDSLAIEFVKQPATNVSWDPWRNGEDRPLCSGISGVGDDASLRVFEGPTNQLTQSHRLLARKSAASVSHQVCDKPIESNCHLEVDIDQLKKGNEKDCKNPKYPCQIIYRHQNRLWSPVNNSSVNNRFSPG